ncbi:MAG TPA: HU family DNA-binding protein [Polyangiaceae bacterium]|jgi:nucleoid DNA-binding protein|nr:HU family DNA-binding protein [Polyangiaceae bacterium]
MATTKKTSGKPLSKSAILEAVTAAIGEETSRKHVKQVVEVLVSVGHKELKKAGVFVLHGFAKFVVVKKPARPAREGIPSPKRSRCSPPSPQAKVCAPGR